MTRKRTPVDEHSDQLDPNKFIFERRVATLCGVGVVATVVYLVVRDSRISDPGVAGAFHLILSLAVATLGATLPGFLHIIHSGKGYMIRAGGALALFVLAFFGAPKIWTDLPTPLQPAKIVALPPISIDFRINDWDNPQSNVIATVSRSYINEAQPAKNALLRSEDLVVQFDGHDHPYYGATFVHVHEKSPWLGDPKGDFVPTAIIAGTPTSHETRFLPRDAAGNLSWRDFISKLQGDPPSNLKVILKSKIDNYSLALTCILRMSNNSKNKIAAYKAAKGHEPMRVTFILANEDFTCDKDMI